MFQNLLSSIPDWFGKIIDGLKVILTGLYIRRSTRIESLKNALEDANKIKTKQLEISSSTPVSADDVRQWMRNDQF